MKAATRAAEDRSERGSREQQRADEHQEDAEEQRAGGTDRDPDSTAQQLSDVAALVLAERDHEAAAEHGHPGAERPDVDERAARHDQRAEHGECDRHDVVRVPDQPVEAVAQPAADVAAVPAEVEDGPEEEAERDRSEPPELRVLGAGASASLR